MDELQEDFEILIDAFISSDNEDTKILAQSLYKQAEKAFYIQRVSNQRELLIAFHEWFLKTHHWSEPMYEKDINDYLSNL